MKCKVRLTRTVELLVEGKNEDAIMDWLRCTTPEEAFKLAKGQVHSDSYDEEIVHTIRANAVVNYVIKED